ncbi:hypothetical protein GCM10007881_60730 [Mesorhizobium huakuii]|uniref:DUF6680 family protein n=1 Tax=Mesorhizobium huakuii TaxID=28104 RepID=UPI00235CE4AB|nr:DUF6680 family protein [Mesorhizobium huakuii]GLQ82550.1 hypothetical protein GCM10007881_60730 [Mesorhizobium huakuii]
MDTTLRLADLAIVFATLLGPVLAVQAQKWVEGSREHAARKVSIFRTLMATRATSLSSSHVEALNAIPIEFYGQRDVVDAWKAYLNYPSQDGIEPAVWAQKRFDLFIDLLWHLGISLGYKFTKVELQRDVYSPKAHATYEAEQNVIRQGLFRLFSGETALPLDIKSFPVDSELAKRQRELQEQLSGILSGDRSVKVELQPRVNE